MNVPYTAAEMGELIATVSTAFTKLQTNVPQNVWYITNYDVSIRKDGHVQHTVNIMSYAIDENGNTIIDEDGNCVKPKVGNIFVSIYWTTDTNYCYNNDWDEFKTKVINKLTELGLL